MQGMALSSQVTVPGVMPFRYGSGCGKLRDCPIDRVVAQVYNNVTADVLSVCRNRNPKGLQSLFGFSVLTDNVSHPEIDYSLQIITLKFNM